MRHDKQPPQPITDMKDGFSVLYTLARAHTLCLTPFMRIGFGTDAFGLAGVIAAGMILLYGGIVGAPEMTQYFVIWFVALVFQRVQSYRADYQGQHAHSRYEGWPWLAMRIPFVKRESAAKLAIEPFLCLMIGTLLCPLSEAVGGFVMLGFITLTFTAGVHREFWRARVRKMRDAQMEQQELLRMFNDSDREF